MSQNNEEHNDLSSPTGGQGAFSTGPGAFIPLQYFTNYIDANILLGRMEEEGISCWLKDENTVTINPLWAQAVGGIKLMVAEAQAERAREILEDIRSVKGKQNACPKCGSENVELVSTPRKASNWLSVLLGGFLFSYAMPPHKVNHCFDCGTEFEPAEIIE
jgi:predicted RNA-binding Zn-ribbon protein involved in translation (DUF1610 family)